MKKTIIIFLVAVLVSFSLKAQIYQPALLFGKEENRLRSKISLGIPNDTITPVTSVQGYPHIAAKGTDLYLWDTTAKKWNLYSSGSFDTATIYANLALKLNISDTAAMLANYRHWLAGYVTSNFATGNLTLTGNRTHGGGGFSLVLSNFSSISQSSTTAADYWWAGSSRQFGLFASSAGASLLAQHSAKITSVKAHPDSLVVKLGTGTAYIDSINRASSSAGKEVMTYDRVTRKWEVINKDSIGGWSLTGNAGTSSGTNFIGTTDAQPLTFKVNNTRVGYISDSTSSSLGNNLFLGWKAGNSFNLSLTNSLIGIGTGALQSAVHGGGNIAIGMNAFNILTYNAGTPSFSASENIGVGDYVGSNQTVGFKNVFLGHYINNVIGNRNTIVGVHGFESNYSGTNNASIGESGLRWNRMGVYNANAGTAGQYLGTTVVGSITVNSGGSGYAAADTILTISAPQSSSIPGIPAVQATARVTISGGVVTAATVINNGNNYGYNSTGTATATLTGSGTGATFTVNLTSAEYNSSLGTSALVFNEYGKQLTAVGNLSGYGVGGNEATYNDIGMVFMGAYSSRHSAIARTTALTNGTAIGYNAKVGCSNCIVLGDTTVSTKVGIGTSFPDSLLTVNQGIWGKRGVRFSGLQSGVGTKALRIDADGNVTIADTTIGGGGATVGTYSTRIGLSPSNGDEFFQTDIARDAPDGKYYYLNSKWHYQPIRSETLTTFWNEFQSITTNQGYLDNGLIGWSGNSGSISFPSAPTLPGVAVFNTSTTTNGYAGFYGGAINNSGAWVMFDKGNCYFKTYINIPTLSDGTDTYSFRIGLGNGLLGDFSNGVYFEYSSATSANWLIKTANYTTRTSTTSGTAVATGWHTLEILTNSNGTSVEYWVDGTSLGTITTNIPGSGNAQNPIMIMQKSAGTNSRSIQVDYVKAWQRLATQRD